MVKRSRRNALREPIAALLQRYHKRGLRLSAAGGAIRNLILKATFPDDLSKDILGAYRALVRRAGSRSVAVRSSATAEDLPAASFAGQHESFLNIEGERALLSACRRCIASLFSDRAIAYRERNRFADMKVALSIGVQTMARSDKGGAGVMFTLDPESGFPGVVRIEGAWGLGEMVVKGTITPDSYTAFKALLNQPRLTPIVEKSRGGAKSKMVYSKRGGKAPTKIVP
ncbi:MAG: PEP/pyruvate-binding domain-containing protein, partial [Micropepsaceae bacterium]